MLGFLGVSLLGCTLPRLPQGPSSAEDLLVRRTRQGDVGARAAAAGRLERLRYREAERQDTAFAWGRFLRQHPQGLFAERAQDRQALQRFGATQRQGRPSGYQRFLRLHPEHRLAPEAWRLLVVEEGGRLRTHGSKRSIQAFLARHPRSSTAASLRQRLEALDLQSLQGDASVVALEAFLRDHASSFSGPAIRQRLEDRLASRMATLGDRAAIRSFLERFPGSRHSSTLDRRCFEMEALGALVRGDAVWLRSELGTRLQGAPPARRRMLMAWLQDGARKLAGLGSFFGAVAPFRPRGSLAALLAAARLGDPPTAAFALRALAHVPDLTALQVIMDRLASPDAGVALEASNALGIWHSRLPKGEARRLLMDHLAELGERRDTAARVIELGLLWSLQDRNALVAALRGRAWHRPWNVLPNVLWLEVVEPGHPEAGPVGTQAEQVLRDELRRLGQLLPRQLGEDTRQRAVSALYELGALAALLGRLGRRFPRGPEWVERLRGLAEAASQRAEAARRAVTTRFPDHVPADPGESDREAARHEASRAATRVVLRGRLARLGTPREVLDLLCGRAPGLEVFCPVK